MGPIEPVQAKPVLFQQPIDTLDELTHTLPSGLTEIKVESIEEILSGKRSDERLLTEIFKIVLLVHYNQNKVHDSNAKVEKKLLRIEVIASKNTFNGYDVLFCRLIGGGIQSGAAILAFAPSTVYGALASKGLVDTVTYQAGNAAGMQLFAKAIMKWGQLGAFGNMAGQACEERHQAHRTETMSNKQLLESSHENTRQKANQELQSAQGLEHQINQADDSRHQVVSQIAAPAA